uniref:Putative secreted protein synganglion overexpressed n=1 Tax=Rhipicephalus microplus TaxID=6941 RepID=A0A6M2D9X1_RHIMP
MSALALACSLMTLPTRLQLALFLHARTEFSMVTFSYSNVKQFFFEIFCEPDTTFLLVYSFTVAAFGEIGNTTSLPVNRFIVNDHIFNILSLKRNCIQ